MGQTSYQMQIDNEFTDVALVTRDGKSIRAHKLILSAASPLLKRMIMDQNINAIYMWDVSNSIMESLIRYIYIGEVAVQKEEFTHVCKIFESLELIGQQQEFNDEDLIANGEQTSDTEEVQHSGNEEDLDTDTETVSEETRKAKEFQHSVKKKKKYSALI